MAKASALMAEAPFGHRVLCFRHLLAAVLAVCAGAPARPARPRPAVRDHAGSGQGLAGGGSVSRSFLANVAYGFGGAALTMLIFGAALAVGVAAVIELALGLALSYLNAVYA